MAEENKRYESFNVSADAARSLVSAIFKRAGCDNRESECIAAHLVEANLRGHESHGIIRTARYVQWLSDGRVKANQSISVESENDVLAIVNGNFGFGQTIGEQTVDLGVSKALKAGVSVTALKHAGHLGCISDWAVRAAERGVASIHFVNVRGSLTLAPFGAKERRGSTSPIACGVPMPDHIPIILDFSTATVAEGKVLNAYRGGASLPADALIDPDGAYSNDPELLYGSVQEGLYPNPNAGPGALTAFGGHKGFGLNFFIEVLAGALTGSGTAGASNEPSLRKLCNGMLSIFLDLATFDRGDFFAGEVRSYIDFVKSAATINPDDEVLIPGEKEQRLKEQRLKTGLPMTGGPWSDILKAARHVGMSDGDIDAALTTTA